MEQRMILKVLLLLALGLSLAVNGKFVKIAETVYNIHGNILTPQIVEGMEGVQLISQRRYFGCNWSNSGLDLGPTTLQTSPILALPAPPIICVNAASSRGDGVKGDKGVLQYKSDFKAQNALGWKTNTMTPHKQVSKFSIFNINI